MSVSTAHKGVQTDNPVEFGDGTLQRHVQIVGECYDTYDHKCRVVADYSPWASSPYPTGGATRTINNRQDYRRLKCARIVPQTVISQPELRNLGQISNHLLDAFFRISKYGWPTDICDFIVDLIADPCELWLKQRVCYIKRLLLSNTWITAYDNSTHNITNYNNKNQTIDNNDLMEISWLIVLFAGGYGFDKFTPAFDSGEMEFPLVSHSGRAVYHSSRSDLETFISDTPIKGTIYDKKNDTMIYYTEITILGKDDEMWIGIVKRDHMKHEDIAYNAFAAYSRGMTNSLYKSLHFSDYQYLTESFRSIIGEPIRKFEGSISYYGGRRRSIEICRNDSKYYGALYPMVETTTPILRAKQTVDRYFNHKNKDDYNSKDKDKDKDEDIKNSLSYQYVIEQLQEIQIKVENRNDDLKKEIISQIDVIIENFEMECYLREKKNSKSISVQTKNDSWRTGKEYLQFEDKRYNMNEYRSYRCSYDCGMGVIQGDPLYTNKEFGTIRERNVLHFYQENDVIGIWFDSKNRILKFYRNGMLQQVCQNVPQLTDNQEYYLFVTTDESDDCLVFDRKTNLDSIL